MGVIHILPDQIANQIAAGEVVERPASVVKELVENALDAGAQQLRIAVTAGGRRRIRVIDDGCGMSRDDALLAFERHATSKLRTAEDLQSVATLGFRGEALPSIAAVSRLTLETGDHAGAGTRLELAAGKLLRVTEAGLPPGTAVTVDQLFFNLPARRKFLKSEATELGHIATLVTHYALAHPELHFELESTHRHIFSLPPAATHRERLEQVFGDELPAQLLELSDSVRYPDYGDAPGEAARLGIFGFVSRPELQKLNRDSIFTFVNRRLVRDRLIQHAISEAYRNVLPSHAFPVVLLFLDLPFAEVDVNVHPAKVEVRFRRSGVVHDAVCDAVLRTLTGARPVPDFLPAIDARPSAGNAWRPPATAPGTANAPDFRLTPQLPPPVPQSLSFGAPSPTSALGATWSAPGTVLRQAPCDTRNILSGEWAEAEDSAGDLTALRALGQVRESFIVAAGTTGLYLIDQHAAHERILFEALLDRARRRQAESQRLLMPAVLQLDPGRAVRFGEWAPLLEMAGFEAESFGPSSIVVRAVPTGLAAERIELLLGELLDLQETEVAASDAQARLARLAATLACHAAIKINTRLETAKIEWLLQALAAARSPMTCPHGRPVLLHYSHREIQRAFKRH